MTIASLLARLGRFAFRSAVVLAMLAAAVFAVEWVSTPPRTDAGFRKEQDLFPYTGLHIKAFQHYRGKDPAETQEYGDTFDIATGERGFFTSEPLSTFPAKRANEFRIILIGAS